MRSRIRQVAVIGGAKCTPAQRQMAFETGRLIAAAGAVLLCGGRSGVMDAAAEGARAAGGRTVGVLPGTGPQESPPNPHIELTIYTGLGQARNLVLVLSGQVVIGIGGSWGTLTEIGLAIRHGIPVVLLDSWELQTPGGRSEPLLCRATSPQEAVDLALEAGRQAIQR